MKIKEKIKKKNEKSKKSLLLTFFFFVFSLLICSCFNPFNPDIDRFPTVTPPSGMGSFSLSLSGASRTVLPSAPMLTHFNKLVLVFTAESVGAVTKTETIDPYISSSLLPAIFLQPGTYSLTVTAYKDTAVAARGTLDSITISLGGNTPGTVTLKALLSEPGTSGKFSWDVTVPNTVNTATATMKITPLAAGGTAAETVSLSFTGAQTTGSRTLNSGPYNVTFSFDQIENGVVMKSLEWSELVHVYSTLESEFTKVFDITHFNSTRYTVTFIYYNGTADGTQTVLHGGTASSVTDPVKTADAYLHVGTSATPGFVFGGWYTDDDTFNNPWVLGSTPVIGDTTLYAKWTGAIDVSDQSGANDVERAIAYVNANPTSAYTLYVGANANVGAQTINAANFDLTIQGYGTGEKIITQNSGTYDSSLFTINNTTASLTLGNNITLQGHGSTTNLVRVQSGTLTMKAGSKITGHTTSSSQGAVYVSGNFTMEGGEISGNHTESTSQSSTGGVYISSSNFIMSGGKIINNTGAYNSGSSPSPADILVYAQMSQPLTPITLSGAAQVGAVTLNTSGDSAYTQIAISASWSGSVSALNLTGGSSSWITRQIVAGSNGYTLTSDDIAKIALGQFRDNTTYQPISDTHRIDTGADIGTLVAKPWDLYAQVADFNSGNIDRTIQVPDNITLSNGNLTISNTTNTLTITSASGGPFTITRGQQDTTAANGLFIVANGAKLILQNIVIDGDQTNHTGNNASLVRVNGGGELTLGNGAALINNRADNGGAVNVNGANAKFFMNGSAKVSGNTAVGTNGGGGVYVALGEFTMSGGTIERNEAVNGGGVLITTNAKFDMTGGTIGGTGTGNKTTDTSGNGGGVYVAANCTFTMSGSAMVSFNTANNNGGGVYNGGTFTMSGGSISDNTATANGGGGVYVYNTGSTFTMSGGTIGGTGAGNTAFNGGGVSVNGGNFTMSGSANVSDNKATGTGGGGVYVSSGTFTMNGGTISSNKATGTNGNGGGVYVNGGTFDMTGGTIGGTSTGDANTAQSGGGGVYLGGGTFKMTSGSVSYNTADAQGGGVFVYSNRTFTMEGGTVSENIATNGGGVYVMSNGTFNMSGNSAVSGNTASGNGGGVYISGSFTISGGELSGNTANWGGGVYAVGAGSTFTMGGGTIGAGNNANSGGGVYITSGTFRIVTGTIYGTNESTTSLHNTAAVGGAALYNSGTAEYGTFGGAGGAWVKTTDGTLNGDLATTNDTIRVANGELGAFAYTADLSSWLSGQMGTGPYTVKMNVNSLGGSQSTTGSVGYALSNSGGKNVSLNLSGSTLTSIDAQAFSDCYRLIGITFPAGVTSIGTSAFYNCTGLTSVTIPVGLTSISDRAFYLCNSLTTVIFEGNAITSFGENAFPGTDALKTAYQAVGGGAGTYIRSGSASNYVWTKLP